MTIRSQMITAAKRAGDSLGSSAGLVIDFLSSRINDDGGFNGRDSRSDLYYTLFGMESLIALGVELDQERISCYLRSFEDGGSLDFVHLACLLRCWADLGDMSLDDELAMSILKRIESYRCDDGGYSVLLDAPGSSVYASFLAVGAYQDAGVEVDNPQEIVNCIESLKRQGCGYANEFSLKIGLTPSTAAAIVSLVSLGRRPDPNTIKWLFERVAPEGGFLPTPSAPMPDLLSTATALFALDLAGISLESIKEPCLDFLDSLWSSDGAFSGSVADNTLDCEYTYYGLLALGLLS